MKNGELLRLYSNLPKLAELRGVKFCHAVNRNKKRMEKEVEAIKEAAQPSEKYQEYENKARELFLEYAIKDKNGNAKVFDGQIKGQKINKIADEHIDEHKAKEKELEAEYEDTIKAREDQLKEYSELLKADVAEDFQFYKVKMEFVPEDISCEQMEIVMPFLADEG